MRIKKRIIGLLMVMVMLFSAIPVQAAVTRSPAILPSLSYTGNVALCELAVFGDYSSDDISAVITLTRGSTTYGSWEVSGKGDLEFHETVVVGYGITYTLTAVVTLNGYEYPPVSTTMRSPSAT